MTKHDKELLQKAQAALRTIGINVVFGVKTDGSIIAYSVDDLVLLGKLGNQ